MFSHLAQFRGGPKDGTRTTYPTESATPPAFLIVHTTCSPEHHTLHSRYERDEAGEYQYREPTPAA